MAHYPRIFDFTSSPIDVCQIAWGTGNGITSSNYFVFDCSRINLVMGGTSSLNSATNSVYLSSIIGGSCNIIKNATGSTIQASCYSCIYGNDFTAGGYSSIISGYCNKIFSGTGSVIFGGSCNLINNQPVNVQTFGIIARNSIIAGLSNSVTCASDSGILSGRFNKICTGLSNQIIAGSCVQIICNGVYSIASGVKNTLCNTYASSIISGKENTMESDLHSVIIGGKGNCSKSTKYSLLSGFCNSISMVTAFSKSNAIPNGSKNKIIESNNSTIIGSEYALIYNSKSSSILAGYGGQGYYKNGNKIVDSCSSILSGGKRIFDGTYDQDLSNNIYSSISVNVIGGASNTATSSFASTILSGYQNLICNSTQSSIIGGETHSIYQSLNSSIIGGSGSLILNSSNSAIIGGTGLSISNEENVVYVSTLKIDSVTQSVNSNKYLIWDNDKCVRYTENTAGVSIDTCEIAWGTGDGITSSNYFLFDCSCINLVMGGNTPSNRVNTATNSVFLSSIIGGLDNCLLGLTSSSIIGGSCNTIWRSCYSSELAGKLNTITQSNFATIINGSASCIVSSNYSTIIGGFSNTLKSAIRNSQSSLILNSTGCALIGTSSCSMIANALCSKIEESQGSLILGGSCDCIVDQSYRSLIFGYRNIILNSKDSIVLGGRSNCICTISICSTIISGCENVIINNACDSIIIHGWNNCIKENSKNSIINSDSSIISASCFSEISSTTQSCICNSEFSSIQASSLGKSCDNCHSALISTRCSCIIGKLGTKDYTFDVILGGCCHTIGTSSLSSIIGGYRNTINRGNCNVSMISSCCSFAQFNTRNSSIIGSEASCLIFNVCNSSIIGGSDLLLQESKNSLLGFSTQSCTCQSNASINIGGYNNRIDQNSNASTLMGSSCALIFCSKFSSIIGSRCSNIGNSDYSSVIAGYKSCICVGSLRSSIISSCDSKIITSTNSVIIGGTNSCICNSQNSAIIGGRGLTLSNENQVVYIPELKINKVDQCEILTKFLAWDDTNKYVRWGTPGLAQGITGSTPYYSGSFWTFSSTNIYNNGVYVGIGLTNSNNVTYATPSSNLHVFGSLSLDVKTASSNYTLTDKNFTLLAYSTSVGMTVSLPQASLAKNRVYVIKRVTTEGQVRINPFAGDNIEGYGSYITLDTQWDYNILQSDGAFMWIKLGGAVGLNLS